MIGRSSWSMAGLVAGFALAMQGCSDSPSSPQEQSGLEVDSLPVGSPLARLGVIATASFSAPSLDAGTILQKDYENGSAVVRRWDPAMATGWQVVWRGATPPVTDAYFDADSGNLATIALDGSYRCPLRIDVAASTSITPSSAGSWKETVSISGSNVAWIDYRHNPTGGRTSEVYMADWSTGTETRLTDDTLYQTRVKIRGTWMVWTEYVHGTRANIRWMDLSTGETRLLDPGSQHQDNPVIGDGWVVWEDYRHATATDSADADIHAWSPATGAVALARVDGFQGRPATSDSRVVWEDYSRPGEVRLVGCELDPRSGACSNQTLASAYRSGSGSGFVGLPSIEGELLAWIATDGASARIELGRWPKRLDDTSLAGRELPSLLERRMGSLPLNPDRKH